jgi:glycosyltransferase involved in cell wall biosynthesis
MKTVVVIPTYNERENIPSLVERILSLATARLDLYFIDDATPDGTVIGFIWFVWSVWFLVERN